MKIKALRSLKYRIALIVFILEVILLTFVLTHTLSFIEQSANDDALKRHKVVFELIRSVTQDSLFAGEFEDLQTFIDTISKDKEILKIKVTNDSSIIVASDTLNDLGTPFIFNADEMDEQWLFDTIGGLGKLYVYFSNQTQLEHIASAQKLGITIAITGIAIITCVSLLFGFLLTRRLTNLSNAVKIFQRDGLTIKVDTKGNDEIALLGESFNYMSSEINNYIIKLKKEQEQLEDKVLQRTHDLHVAQDELINKNKELEILSTTDRLTRLYNRAFLEDNLTREIARSNREKHTFGIILLDIDNFKIINDTFGHDVGDKVIKIVANAISNSVRNIDIVGRWGGEEYLIICPKTDFDQLYDISKRILDSIRRCEVRKPKRITASIGITLFNPGDTQSKIIKHADLALYNAKNSGRDCIKTYDIDIASQN